MPARVFTLILVAGLAGPAAAGPPQVTIEKFGDDYEFKVNGDLVTKYHTRSSNAKPYLWPLNAPGGIPLTRDWPMKIGATGESTDHVHQKSAWFCYGDVVPEGVELVSHVRGVKGVDFWSEASGHGIIEVKSVEETSPGQATLRTRNAWKTAEGRVILDEVQSYTLYPLDGAYLIVMRSTLKPPTAPVTFADTKEGAFGVRVSDKLCKKANPASVIRNSSGAKGEAACWGRKADWCDYSGKIDGKPAGIAMFDDPTNRSRACWHVRSYGLMAANPFGRAASGFPAEKDSPEPLLKLKPGEELRLRYGLLLHTGDADSGKFAEYYRRFLALK